MSRRRMLVLGAVVAVAAVTVAVAGRDGGLTSAYTRLHVRFSPGKTTDFSPAGASRKATPGPARKPPTGSLNVVVLGDSVPAGNACGCTPFGERAARRIATEQRRPVTIHNLAVGGATSRDVIEQLGRQSIRDQISRADLVLIEVGANDFDESDASDADCQDITSCFGSQLTETTGNIAQIVDTVKGLLTNSSAQISLLGYWNVFTDGKVGRSHGTAYVTASGALTKELNREIRGIADKAQVSYPDVYTPFKGADGSHDPTAYLAPDGDHPNNAGHQLLADAVVAALGDSIRNL